MVCVTKFGIADVKITVEIAAASATTSIYTHRSPLLVSRCCSSHLGDDFILLDGY